MLTATALKRRTARSLRKQGYAVVRGGMFYPESEGAEAKKDIHFFSRAEKIAGQMQFINRHWDLAASYMPESTAEIDVDRISPILLQLDADGSENDILFRWWNLVWWSLPYEKAYGRQMRFLVWDNYHQAPMGLIGLQSPILNWKVRDQYLGIGAESRDFWVNQSMSAQRLGALPPYNNLLGGKLVAMLMTSDEVRDAFRRKYENTFTLLQQRSLPADLLFITTTGAYGKSSVYNRLRFDGEPICKHIGYSLGYGSFHIPNTLYEGFISYLRQEGHNPQRAYGSGPSRKIKNIDLVMRLLGFQKGAQHGMGRAVYLFPFVKNLPAVIQEEAPPQWHSRSITALSDFWRERWASKRVDAWCTDNAFSKKKYLADLSKDLKNCQRAVKQV